MTTLEKAGPHTRITQGKDVRGRRLNRYTASIVTADGRELLAPGITTETPEAALAALNAVVDASLDNAYRRRYVFTGDGTVFALYWNSVGWAYDIADANPDRNWASTCLMATYSYDEALAAMTRHAEQGFGGVIRVL